MRLIIFLLFWLIIFSLPDPGFCTQPPIDNSNQLEPIFQQLFSAPKKAKIPSNLLRPKSWQDAVNILKKDNIALFSLADTIFLQHLKKHPQAIKVLAWRAQLYLTWADSALLTSYTLVNLNKHAAKSAARKNKNGKQTEKAIEILNKIGIDKLKAVQKMVHILKQNGPDLYETWRVAADYHRLRGEWKQFNLAMFKVEQLNPGSNGLVFLKGAAAFHRDNDWQTAINYYTQATKIDPQFTKAWYFLANSYMSLIQIKQAIDTLQQTIISSPAHPLAHYLLGKLQQLNKVDLIEQPKLQPKQLKRDTLADLFYGDLKGPMPYILHLQKIKGNEEQNPSRQISPYSK